VYDNFSTGRVANLAILINEPRFTLVEQDIRQPFDLGKVDCLFNFASPASPADYARLGPETLIVGSEGTRNVLDLARKWQAGFLRASTSECYGEPEVHPQTVGYWPGESRWGRDRSTMRSKRFSGALIMAATVTTASVTHMVRIQTPTGRACSRPRSVIPNLMIQARRLRQSHVKQPSKATGPAPHI
jgi:dTDP-glucose 4,6-dehydratase